MGNPKRRSLQIVIWIGVSIFLVYVFSALLIYHYSFQYHELSSDAALVLGAGSSNGNLSPVFQARMDHAIDLVHRKSVKFLILTGGFGEGQHISDSEAAKRYAISKEVSEEVILIEDRSTITYENVLFAKKLMQEKDIQTVLLVSDPLHMKRAMYMCEEINLKALPSPTPYSKYKTWRTRLPSLLYETFFFLGHFFMPR